MSPKRFQLIQLFFEAALPIYGILFWKWNFAFILFYFLLDWLANSVLTGLKIRKRYSFQQDEKNNSKWIVRLMLACAFFAPTFLFAFKLLNHIYLPFNLWSSFEEFFFYEDMGVSQGYVLFPLIAFNAWSQYRMQFSLPQRFKTTTITTLVNSYLLQNLFILGGTLLCFTLSFIVSVPELTYSLLLIGGCVVFRFFKRN